MENIQIPLTLGDETVKVLERLIGNMLVEATKNLDANGNVIKSYMNKKEAAEYLNVSYQTLKKFIDNGLPVIEVSGVNMIRRVDIDAFMEANKK
ncbi:helix-turn-helix domain-containing protein [Macrococcus equi]|uniref:helix-turn-helix domain-containing protein n=1 Tax=Macrococcus equi TaxID=3395462 RepID=UPI0039BDCBA6